MGIHFYLGLDQGNIVIGPLFVIIGQVKGQEGLLEFLVGFPGIDPYFGQLKGVADHEYIGGVLLTPYRVGNHMNGSLVAHVTEQDGVTGSDHQGEHPLSVGCGSPSFVENDDVHIGKGMVLQIAYVTGELYQFIIFILFYQLRFGLCSGKKESGQQCKEENMDQGTSRFHAAKIAKKAARLSFSIADAVDLCFINNFLFMITQKEIRLSARPRGYHLITRELLEALGKLPETGMLNVFIQHSSAGLTLNENADPSVRDDFESFMNFLVPENHPLYSHIYEGADDMPAHIKSSLIGAELTIPITNHRLNLGTWQGIYLCEFRNHGGSRKIVVTIMS